MLEKKNRRRILVMVSVSKMCHQVMLEKRDIVRDCRLRDIPLSLQWLLDYVSKEQP